MNISQKELATIALNHHLYVDNWNLENYFQDIKEYGDKSHRFISIIFHHEQPVAVATLHKVEKNLDIYVDNSFRKQGLGIQVIEQILSEYNISKQDVYAFLGESGSEFFYQKAGIACFNNSIPMNKKEIELFINHTISYEDLVKLKIKEKLDSYHTSSKNLKIK